MCAWQSVLERVSRFTQADIITSIDGLVSKTALGLCHTFYTQANSLPDGQYEVHGFSLHNGLYVTQVYLYTEILY